jgi:hypothetical protein
MIPLADRLLLIIFFSVSSSLLLASHLKIKCPITRTSKPIHQKPKSNLLQKRIFVKSRRHKNPRFI